MKFFDIGLEIDSRHKIAESVEHSNSENQGFKLEGGIAI